MNRISRTRRLEVRHPVSGDNQARLIADRLDAWLPAATMRTQHRRHRRHRAGALWEAARAAAPGLNSGPAAFRDWSEPGTVRVPTACWPEPLRDGRTEIVSEARVAAVDRASAKLLRALGSSSAPSTTWSARRASWRLFAVRRNAETGCRGAPLQPGESGLPL